MRRIIIFLASIILATTINSKERVPSTNQNSPNNNAQPKPDFVPIAEIRPLYYGGENWKKRGVRVNFKNCLIHRPKSPCGMCKNSAFQRILHRYSFRAILEKESTK